ncbi:RagB/SusD family nutrient uptake outer membrane protein [Flavobacterium sp. GSP27]|uniref:RagB/SusD family nutrient uptake outer membrane protein n=1 Tax=unclassified Flavobacterium TaxID=196869 RepID=UPI000F81B987|nr:MULTISPECIES: RagB/SusD family nutrient uptake outer membrane protein [unclassified Flavobacterium]RTY80541.1 RagB/SusD family nutrient uptake outer membrane protein [Flavobacterium sp. LS1P28]RTY83875.1 RagB/SusD family nutrient uptake outer membrane protein [Flavobacterium sp. ZB4P23]RTY90535.1 RagB/SusD family nutrient uptake outer membrane protein [Flavobacterium sp. GSN2]RTZ07729.1 RagB/SusD family nutrient uptake outer membrane protein [Flavobacterium sp. GSP27]
MKKIIYLVALSFALNSCDDEDITFAPYNAISESIVLRNSTDFENMLTGAYSYMIKNGGDGGYGTEFVIDSEVMTDNLILKIEGRQSNANGFRLLSVPNSSHFNYYISAYRAAETATRIIENIEIIPQNAARDNIEGQARFIRAINNFDMVRIYSKIPTQAADANASLGMYYLDVVAPFSKPTRPTVQDTYKKVVDDLLIAADKIGTTNTVASGKASKAAVYALLSRVYLYLGDFSKVIQYGNLAIAGNAVCPRTDFVNLWKDTDIKAPGVLFKLRIDQVDGVTPGVVYNQTVASGIRSEYVVPKSFSDLFQTTDIRKSAYIVTSPFNSIPYNHVIKYLSRLTGNPAIVDIKVLRVEEVYLNMAEAQYRINGGGLAFLDAVRSQRYSSFVSGNETGATLLNAILLERRLELAFEMDRFFTLKRLGLGMVRNSVEGDYASGAGTKVETSALTIPAGNFKWQLPIPQSQIDLNSNLQQNPGY